MAYSAHPLVANPLVSVRPLLEMKPLAWARGLILRLEPVKRRPNTSALSRARHSTSTTSGLPFSTM